MPVQLKVLIACEESGIVRDEFIKLGHDAISCDLKPTAKPGPHYQGDIRDIISNGFDLMIAFPPCTHLAVSGAAWFEEKRKDGRQQEGIDFFMLLANAQIPKIAIENPVGIMSTIYKKPTQIIHPYYFGDSASKKTCLWLKNILPLYHAREPNLFNTIPTHVHKGEIVEFESGAKMQKWYADSWGLQPEQRAELRSKTFPGIAKEMALQWGNPEYSI